jgi:transposase
MGKSITDLTSVTTVGLDLAKHVFQVHGVDALGRVVVAKAIRRNKLLEFFASLPRCLVGLEACGSAHHWARELVKLGHDARMMPPAYVKPYIRRQKNDASDAAAICEAVTRPYAVCGRALGGEPGGVDDGRCWCRNARSCSTGYAAT